MKKRLKSLLSCLCLAAMISTAGTIGIQANTTDSSLEAIRIYGPVTKTDGGSLSIHNNSKDSYQGQIQINISDKTRILDAVTGYPVSYDKIRDGETAYIDISPVMTMSIPPMSNAIMILYNIPADYKVPEYVNVESMSMNAAGTSGTLTAANGINYTIPGNAQIVPYMTRNVVTIQDLVKGTTCLLWSDSQNNASKVMIFPNDGNASHEPTTQTGWVKKGNVWYYFDKQGQLFTGWLQDKNDWYYLDPSTGIMKTGFVTVEDKTYYMLEDGRMLKKSKTFTPDENGVLH